MLSPDSLWFWLITDCSWQIPLNAVECRQTEVDVLQVDFCGLVCSTVQTRCLVFQCAHGCLSCVQHKICSGRWLIIQIPKQTQHKIDAYFLHVYGIFLVHLQSAFHPISKPTFVIVYILWHLFSIIRLHYTLNRRLRLKLESVQPARMGRIWAEYQ